MNDIIGYALRVPIAVHHPLHHTYLIPVPLALVRHLCYIGRRHAPTQLPIETHYRPDITRIYSSNSAQQLVMTSHEGADSISLREPQHLNHDEQERNTIDDAGQAARQRDLDRKRAIVLIGSALSQLPIWGMIARISTFK